MRDVSEDFIASLSGSRIDERVEVTVFREGNVLAQRLNITEWTFSESMDQQVKGSFSCTVADDTGELIPYQMSDVLAPSGSTLVVDYVTPAHRMRLGEYLITGAEPSVDLFLRKGKVAAKMGLVKLSCADTTTRLVADRLLAPESPPANATIASEMSRLSRDTPIVFTPGTDGTKTVPSSVVYEKERMNALDDLAARAGGFIRVGADSTLQVVSSTPAMTPVWAIVGGNSGTLISYSQKLSIDGIYNGVISTSSAGQDANTNFIGKAFENDGPLRWGGPLGYRPLFHSSSLISSEAEAKKDAETRLAGIVGKRVIDLAVTAVPNPALQVGDVVSLPALSDGKKISKPAIRGILTHLSIGGDNSGLKVASYTVRVASAEFAKAISEGVWDA